MATNKSIGMVLDKTFPPDPRVENEAEILSKNGFSVFLFCLSYSSENLGLESYKNFNVVRYQSNKLIYKLSALSYDVPLYHLFLKQSLKTFIEDYQIDILHIHDLPIAKAVFDVNKKFKKKIVLDLHENRPEIMKFYPHLKKGLGKIININRWKKAEAKYIIKADKTIVVTQQAKQYYLNTIDNLDTKKFQIIPNTVQKAFFKTININESITNKFKDSFNLLYIGDTGERRGLLTVLKAIPEIRKNIPNVHFIIVGTSSFDNELKNWINQLNIKEVVTFTGWQKPNTFQSYISASNICISPLHKNIHHDTTFANKVFQYLSFAKPVLVSSCNAQQELMEQENCGWVHEEQDTKDFTKKVLEIYHNPNEAKLRGENGKHFIKDKFCWEIVSKDLVKMYKELFKDSRI